MTENENIKGLDLAEDYGRSVTRNCKNTLPSGYQEWRPVL